MILIRLYGFFTTVFSVTGSLILIIALSGIVSKILLCTAYLIFEDLLRVTRVKREILETNNKVCLESKICEFSRGWLSPEEMRDDECECQ